jgi:hypothetical protein
VNWARGGARRLIRPILLAEPNNPARYLAFRGDQPDFLIEKSARRDPASATPFPVPPRELLVALGAGGYGDTREEFLEIGRSHVENMFSILAQTGTSHDIGYFKEKLGRFHEVVGVKEEDHGFQTRVLVRRKAS